LHIGRISTAITMRKTEAWIAHDLGVSRNLVRTILGIVLRSHVIMDVERAYAETERATETGQPVDEKWWAPVEDVMFKGFPGFREARFYRSMMRDIKAGRLARRVSDGPGPKGKRAQKGGKPAESAGVPPGFSAKDTRQQAKDFDKLRGQI
jgi:hypothetical protein